MYRQRKMEQSDKSLNRIILCLGSNRDKERNIARAAGRLGVCFTSFRTSEPVCTEAVDCPGAAPFLNQIAVAYTPLHPDEIKPVLKQIEGDLHRSPSDKQCGSIPIDIDLLQWNDQILKPGDMARWYVRDGIRRLLADEGEQV